MQLRCEIVKKNRIEIVKEIVGNKSSISLSIIADWEISSKFLSHLVT